MILRILRIGVPSGLENSLFQVGKVLLSRLVSSLGTYAIAANAISWTMASLLCVPVNSVGVGLLTISGVCMGAGNPDGAEYYTRKLVRVAYIGMGVTCGLMQLFIEPLSSLFGLSEPSRVLACQVIRLYAVMVFLEAPISFVVRLPPARRGRRQVPHAGLRAVDVGLPRGRVLPAVYRSEPRPARRVVRHVPRLDLPLHLLLLAHGQRPMAPVPA